jgi:ABC-type uncharacterized transport system ATPase component
MRIAAADIRIGTGPGAALPALTVGFAAGDPAVVAVDGATRATVTALAVAGRMRLDGGAVYVDGRTDSDLLRRTIAVVDAPTVSDPSDDVALHQVVREEIVLAGHKADRPTIARAIAAASAKEWADAPFGSVPPAIRIRLLADIAVSRAGVRGVVLTLPDRHGGDPRDLLRLIHDLSERGFAVLALTSAATLAALEGLESK